MNTQHNDSCAMSFGRPSKEAGRCPRCDELRSGASPRKGWGSKAKEQEAKRSESIRAHYASGNCSKTCGPVCTRFDW